MKSDRYDELDYLCLLRILGVTKKPEKKLNGLKITQNR